MKVDEKTFPYVFNAFREMDYDNGAVNRYEPEREAYSVPQPFASWLAESEAALKSLTDEEFEEFCCGEHSDVMALAGRSPGLAKAHELLQAYFEQWEKP